MADGSTIDCDFVVVGIGVTPRTALAEAAGIEVDNGIVVNERLETGVPGIFAAGTRSGASSSPSGWRPVVWWAARTSTSKESPDAIQALIRSGESVDAALARPGRGAGRPRLNSAERTWDCACNG
jgi:alkyl hydroperoxide reductase subunit AhpF